MHFHRCIYIRFYIPHAQKGDERRLYWSSSDLNHWGRATHICVGNLTIIGSDNGLSPGRRQAIIWTNNAILLIPPLGTKFSEISIEILTFSFKKTHLKLSAAEWRPFRLGLNVLKIHYTDVTWASWHLISQATWLFVQQIINNNENIEAPLLGIGEGNPLTTDGFFTPVTRNAERVSMSL